jgi:hypothetical protein
LDGVAVMLPPTLGDFAQAVVAATVVFNCWQTWNVARVAAKERKKLAVKIDHTASVVETVKAQTDGITDQLLKATGEVKFAEGVKHGEKYAERNEKGVTG